MRLLLATGNLHKLEEFGRIFHGHTLLLPADLGIDFEHEESGATYLENAVGKAGTLRRLLSAAGGETIPIISDDSGISVPALGGAPGIYSARYGRRETGRDLSAVERNLFLLEKMAGIEDRRAFFVCAMVLMIDEYRFYAAQEILPGVVAREPAGTGGFGYDPLLYLPDRGKTVAQLDPGEKDLLSHRGKAARTLKTLIENPIERNFP